MQLTGEYPGSVRKQDKTFQLASKVEFTEDGQEKVVVCFSKAKNNLWNVIVVYINLCQFIDIQIIYDSNCKIAQA